MRPQLLSCLIKLKTLRYLGLGFVYVPKGKYMSKRDQQKHKKEEKHQEHSGVLCNKRAQGKGEAVWVDEPS